jgi:NTE family protein
MAIMRRWRRRRREGPVAFVLSGGGNLGALQIGMLRALAEFGIRPDLIVGCSVGAINGAALAEDPSPAGIERLERLWRELDGNDLMPRSILPRAVALTRRGEAIHDNDGLRRALEKELTARTFEELAVPFQCVATDVVGVQEVWFRSGPLIDPILASAALPAVYPAVEIDGVRYLDGAIVADVPMARAVELGARTLYVLQVGAFSRPRPEPRRPLDVAVQSYWLARHHRFKADLAAIPEDVAVHLLPTGQTPAMRYNDFTRSVELMAVAHAATTDYLAGGSARPEMPAGVEAPTGVAGDDGADPLLAGFGAPTPDEGTGPGDQQTGTDG